MRRRRKEEVEVAAFDVGERRAKSVFFMPLLFSFLFFSPKAETLTCTSLPLGEKVVSEKEYCFCFGVVWKRRGDGGRMR